MELDDTVQNALKRLVQAGVPVFNQSVLLHQVNDTIETLVTLSETLIQCQVLPYYLHMLDRVHGTSHFEVSTTTALKLLTQLRERLPGYLVPKLVREIQGNLYKQPL